ncbi:MAG: virulence RhuM family protein [Muribaculaceae bacterium]|nr:virulence RhuM family protein [Muribaculaceae bacterium]
MEEPQLNEVNPIPNIQIYMSDDGTTRLEVKLENDTVWLTQSQMVQLFQTTKQNVSLHINNIFKEGELEKKATVKEYLIVQNEGGRTVTRSVNYYDLDVIISVGYRVKSHRGTQFRRWASGVLKEFLIKGYAINEQLKLNRYEELKSVVRLMGETIQRQNKLTSRQAKGLLSVVTDYVYALDTLDRYDYQQLSIEKTTQENHFHATYENAMEAILSLREKFGGNGLFANEKDDSFRSSIGQIYQTWDGQDLYPSVEEKAAMLLYLVTKNGTPAKTCVLNFIYSLN